MSGALCLTLMFITAGREVNTDFSAEAEGFKQTSKKKTDI